MLKKSCKIGSDVNIEKGARVSTDTIIGEGSAVGKNCSIPKRVQIGRNLLMGPDCLIYKNGHYFNSETKMYKGSGNTEHKTIIIEDNVWIDARVLIVPGVTIGKGQQ